MTSAPVPIDSREYVKLNNQFVVPVVTEDRVAYMVIVSLSVETAKGRKETIFSIEPKLRDAFLQAMFDHANLGGFDGVFTNAAKLDVLRQALVETARDTVGDIVSDVLVMDITRQDV